MTSLFHTLLICCLIGPLLLFVCLIAGPGSVLHIGVLIVANFWAGYRIVLPAIRTYNVYCRVQEVSAKLGMCQCECEMHLSHVVLSKPSMIRQVLQLQGTAYRRHSTPWARSLPMGTEALLASDYHWQTRHPVVLTALSMFTSDDVLGLVGEATKEQVERLRQRVNSVHAVPTDDGIDGDADWVLLHDNESEAVFQVELSSIVSRFSFAVLFNAVFGSMPDRGHELHELLCQMSKAEESLADKYNCVLPPSRDVSGEIDKFHAKVTTVHGIITELLQTRKRKLISERFFKLRSPAPMIDPLLINHHTPLEDDQELPAELVDDVLALFVQSRFMCESTVTWAMHEAMCNHRVWLECSAQAQREVATPTPLFDAVVSETLRLHPPIPAVLRKTTKEHELVTTENKQLSLPVGIAVQLDVATAHRDPAMWRDPNSFTPERWMDQGELRDQGIEDAFFPFLGGDRDCLYRELVVQHSAHVLKALLASFTFKLVSGEGTSAVVEVGLV